MFSDLMTTEGYTYDFVYDWLMKKSERQKIRGALMVEDEEEKEPKRMTKAEKFRLTKEKFAKNETYGREDYEERKLVKESSSKPNESKPKDGRGMPSSKRKALKAKVEAKKEEKKKDIYSAMKDAGFEAAKPKIATSNVRSYRY